MDDNLEDVVANIKATLNSSQNKITLEALNRDYISVVGCGIPFRRLNFSSLEDLIRATPGLSLNRIGHQTFVEVKADAKTAHIAKLVREQKAAKKKSKGRGPPRRNFGGPPRNNYNRSSSYRNFTPRPSNNSYSHKSYNSHDNRFKDVDRTYSNGSGHDNRYKDLDRPYSNGSENRTSYSNYRRPEPCAYNFSDNDDDNDLDDDFLECDTPSSDEEAKAPVPIVSATREPNLTNNFKNLHITVENKHFGGGTTNTRLRGGLKIAPRSYSHRTNTAEDDVGYGSMNGNSSDKTKTDKPLSAAPTTPERNVRSLLKTSPAQILAAGRAATQKADVMEPPSRLLLPISRQPLHPSRLPQPAFPPSRIFESAEEATATGAHRMPRGTGDIPFKSVNKVIEQSNPQLLMGAPFMMSKPSTSRTMENRLFKSVPPNLPVPLMKTKPSKMIEDKMFKPGPDSAPSYADGTQCQKLFAFAMKYKLGFPEFSNFHKYDADTNETLHMCKLKINGSTFPSELYQHPSLSEVQEHAAEEALRELKAKYESGDSTVFSTATETEEIIRRITEIVSEHHSGLKSEFIEMRFREIYREKLPRNWLDIIKSQSLLSVETLVGGIFVYPPQDAGACSLSSTNKLPPLVLPETDTWSVFVTTCVSSNYVHFRLVGEEYDAKYDAMSQTMEERYNKAVENGLSPAEPIREGNYYAACLQGLWYRIKVLSQDLGNKFRVCLVDVGETEEVLSECIFPLDDEFTQLPAQAMRCSLTGLEKYHNDDYVTESVNLFTTGQRALVAQVNSRNPHLKLTLFDTSGDDDMNVNEVIEMKINRILSPPKMPKKSNFEDVYLTRVAEDGRAHVQIISQGLKSLRRLMADVKREMSKHAERYILKSKGNLVGGKIVLAKYEGDQMWHRAVVVSLLNRDQMAEVRFIDYGNTEIVSIDHIAELKYFSNSLSAIPPQAVEVQLVKATSELFTQSVIEFIMSLAQVSDGEGTTSSRKFLMKVIEDEHVPVVELFLRDDKNEIVRLNDIIGLYYTDYRAANFINVKPNLASIVRKKQKPSRSNDLSRGFSVIPRYELPEPPAQLNVKVSMIINPSYFVVQPLEHVEDLHRLTDDMTKYYSREKPVVGVESICVGNTFAVQNEEKLWCRGLVISVAIDSNEVSLYCVDYGNTVGVDFTKVYMLMPNFRKLPALALKAELAGIRPVHNTWNMHDCIRFHELLQTKECVSVIVEATEAIVSVLLIDTSREVDVDIGSILVEEGRALDVCA